MARVERKASRPSAVWVSSAAFRLHAPLGLPGGEWLVGRPGGKAFIQPEVVPPLHGDQVAEPLVREFVRDDRGHRLAHANRGRGFVDEQHALAEGDGAGILHGSGGEVGHADDVELAERISDPEVVVEELHLMFGGGQGERGEALLVGGGAHADGDAVAGAAPAHEVADEQRHEIGGHLLRGGEGHGVFAGLGAGRVRNRRAVRDGRVGGVDHERDVERGFLGRLVEAREGSPRIGGFHLTDRVVPAVGLAQVEAAQLVVEDAGVGDVDRGRAGRHPRGHREGGGIGGGVEGHGGRVRPSSCLDGDGAEGELGGVQRDRRGRLIETHADLGPSAEGGVRQVGREPQRVVLGRDARRQALRGGGSSNEREDDGKGDPHGSTVADAGARRRHPASVAGTNAVTAARVPGRSALPRPRPVTPARTWLCPGRSRAVRRTLRAGAWSARLRLPRARPRPDRRAPAGSCRRRVGRTRRPAWRSASGWRGRCRRR